MVDDHIIANASVRYKSCLTGMYNAFQERAHSSGQDLSSNFENDITECYRAKLLNFGCSCSLQDQGKEGVVESRLDLGCLKDGVDFLNYRMLYNSPIVLVECDYEAIRAKAFVVPHTEQCLFDFLQIRNG